MSSFSSSSCDQTTQTLDLIRQSALHCVEEYSLWKSNPFVGSHMGSARDLYLQLLRKRSLKALRNYQQLRKTHRPTKMANAA